MDKKDYQIVIVDDHEMVRDGFERIVRNAFPQANVQVFKKVLDTVEADVLEFTNILITDISFEYEAMDGFALIEHIKNNNYKTKTIVVSMHENALYLQRARELNVAGYIHKREASERIIQAINNVSEGKTYFSDETNKKIEMAESSVEVYMNLYPREKEVFMHIVQGKVAKQIAVDMDVSVKTIHTHRLNLYRKFEVNNSFGLIQYALKQGIIEPGDIL